MAAIRVASTSFTLRASNSSSSSSCYYNIYPSVFTKFRFGPRWGISYAATPLSSSRAKRMAHSITRAVLGLTEPKKIDSPKISFAAKEIDLVEWKGDILAVGVTEKDMEKDENLAFKNVVLQKLDLQLGGLLSEASSEEDFTGKAGQSTVLRLSGVGSKRVSLIGLGAASATKAYCSLGESVAAAAKSAQASYVAITLASSEGIAAELKPSTASAIATGAILGTFDDNRFKSESKKPALQSIDIIGLGCGPEIEKKLKYAEDVCSGIILGKELVNAPANVLTPGVLAEEATRIASVHSDVFTAKILDVEQCKELKMGSFLAVAAASSNPPYFIHLCYKPPGGTVRTKLALVGKGLTFDCGGYNIKTGPGCMIELMKFDMGGSAAVLGAAKALGQIKPDGVEVHFIVAACENMISGTGMRPGDILTASNGKTIELTSEPDNGPGGAHSELDFELLGNSDVRLILGRSPTSLQNVVYVVALQVLLGSRSVGGQWIHALCAEWVLESTYRRGQVSPIEGMDNVSKGADTCTVCRRKQSVCLKCSYGHCQTTFHPTCARSACFYMTVRTNGDKLQHKAYCEKHSIEQKAKADTQRHGMEEFKSLKQVRVCGYWCNDWVVWSAHYISLRLF